MKAPEPTLAPGGEAMVIKHRRKIAALATKLAIASLSEFRKKNFSSARTIPVNGGRRTVQLKSASSVTRRVRRPKPANARKQILGPVGSASAYSGYHCDDSMALEISKVLSFDI